MIGRFSDPHGGLGVPDGLVEPAELREHVGEPGPRDRRLDAGRPEALVAEVPSSATIRSSKVAASLNSPRMACVWPRLVVATTSIE